MLNHPKWKDEIFNVCSGEATSLDRIKRQKQTALPPTPPPQKKTQGRNYTKAKKRAIKRRTSTGSEVFFILK